MFVHDNTEETAGYRQQQDWELFNNGDMQSRGGATGTVGATRRNATVMRSALLLRT
jgi:hypothetical protein